MNNKKKVIIIGIISVVILLLIIGIIFFLLFNKKESTPSTKNKSQAEKIIDVYLKRDVTKKELNKYFKTDSGVVIIIGKDSFLTYKLPSDLSKKYNLEKYEEERKTYGEIVIDKYLNNFKYNEEPGKDVVKINIKSFDIGQYLSDLDSIKVKLIDKSLNNSNLKEEDKYSNIDSVEMTANYYKAETIAMKVLNNYLSEYKIVELDYGYDLNNKKELENKNLYNLISNTNKNKESSEEVINNMINEAIKDGLIKNDSPLSL